MKRYMWLLVGVLPALMVALVGGRPAMNVAAAVDSVTEKIVFTSTRIGGQQDIYTMNPDGSNQKRLTTRSASDIEAEWSPDGTKIVFASRRASGHVSQIFVMNDDGSDQVQLTHTVVDNYDPTWSPDGTKIALSINGRISAFYLSGGSAGQMTNGESDSEPDWSPSGDKIAFTRYERVDNRWTSDIWIVDTDGTNLVNLTDNPSLDFSPRWSPDGSKIVYSRRLDDYNSEIFVINADGSGQTRLTHNSDSDFSPSWSPDGTKIVFVSYRPEDGDVYGWTEIYMMDADGGNLVNVTSSVGGDYAPDWRAGVRDTGRRTFMPTADAHVMQSRPTVNFGHKTTLNARQTTKAVNSYVKFRVSSLDTVTEATLRLYVTNPGKNGAVYAASSNYADSTVPWVESGLVWNNAPSVQGAPLTNISPKRAGTWLAVNVTAAVQAAVQANDSHVTLVITNPTADTLVFRSRNATQLRPELVVATQ